MAETTVIAGAGHAAGQVIASLRMKKYAGNIVLIGDEEYLPYQRPPLSKKFLSGELPAERLYVKPETFYHDSNTKVHLNRRVESIDPAGRTVLVGEEKLSYDNLVLATGARVRKLELEGADLDGVHYLRSIADVLALREQISSGTRLAVVGGGYIGLEVAAVAAGLGARVTVVEMADRVMSRVVSSQVSDFYHQLHSENGVKLLLATHLKRFTGDHRVQHIELGNGESVPVDAVLIGVGVQPNTEVADDAGLLVDNGIVVDELCRTSVDNIYAVGDCTNHPNGILGRRLRLESVHNALEQAKTAAANICGEELRYEQVPWFWSDQYDVKLQIAGISEGHDRTVLRGDPAERSFSCLYLRNGSLIAIDSVNAPRDFMQAKALIAAHEVISPALLANPDIPLKDMA